MIVVCDCALLFCFFFFFFLSSLPLQQEWRSFRLSDKRQLSPNSFFLRFELPTPDSVPGLPVASCLLMRAPIGERHRGQMVHDGSSELNCTVLHHVALHCVASHRIAPGSPPSDPYVVRPYTPVSSDDSPGHIDFVIKAYVPDGKLSQHLGAMAVGDSIEMKGPINKIKYETNMKKEIGMIAGGTGITPMLQVGDWEDMEKPAGKCTYVCIHCIVHTHTHSLTHRCIYTRLQVAEEALRRPGDVTRFSLIFGNIREEDILLRERIDELARAYPSRFRVHYTLDKPGPEWEGGRG